MDIAWLILDSLSFSATPFASTGENTMPKLSKLADKSGVVYTNAYVPGPTSPSSHGSFFTGEPPSRTGMHEAFPYFKSDLRTIAEVLSETHRSLLISANPYIFNGLDRGFDVSSDLREEEYLVFPEAGDPAEFGRENEFDSKLRTYFNFLTTSDKPLRSLINGIQYKRVTRRRRSSLPESTSRDENKFQYANEMNVRIRDFIEQSDEKTFIVANYMDIHPPLDASEEAIKRFCGRFSPDEMPIGVRGQDVYNRFRDGDNEIAEKMYALLQATIWDTDRKVAPLVRSLLQQDAIVVVTADHGIWFRREFELDEERIHVPLIIFAPDESSREVDCTVNLRSLPRTTLARLNNREAEQFRGRDLLTVEEDSISITEFIYTSDEDGKPINPRGNNIEKINFDMAAVCGDDRLDYIDTKYVTRNGDGDQQTLREEIETRLLNDPQVSEQRIEYEDSVEQRLKDFGYL